MANEIDIRVDSNPSRQGIRRIEAALVAMGRTADRVGQQSDAAFTRLYEQIRLTAESAGDLRARIDALSGIAPVLQRLSQTSGPSAGMLTSVRELITILKLADGLDTTAFAKAVADLSSTKIESGSATKFKNLATGIRELKSAMSMNVRTATLDGMATAITRISNSAPSAAKVKNLLALGQAMQSYGTFRAPTAASVKNFGDFITAVNRIVPANITALGNLGIAISSIDGSRLRFTQAQAASLTRLLAAIQGLTITPGTGAALQGLAQVLNGLANQANAATAAINASNQAMNRGTREGRLFGGQIGTLSSFIGRTEAAFQGFVAVLGTNAILREIGTLQKFQSGLTAIGGASSFAAVEMRRANDIADRFGISLNAVAGGYSQMLAAANSSDLLSLDEARSIFEGVSQAVRVFGLSTEDAEGVYRALTQIVSKGSLQMEELRGQLGDRLPGAVSIFARGLGVTTAQLMDMTKQAEVTGDTLRRGLLGFSSELKSITDAGLGEASTSVIAELGRLSTAFTNFAGMLGESGFSEAIINISETLRSVMSSGITEFLIGGLGGALALVTSNMGFLAGAVALFGVRLLLSRQAAHQFGLATTAIGVHAINAAAAYNAATTAITAGITRATVALRAMQAAGTGAWATATMAALRGVGTAGVAAFTSVGVALRSLFQLMLTNPFTTLAVLLLTIPPIIEAVSRSFDNARIAQDGLDRASELQSKLLVDVSRGAKEAAANYAKLTDQQRLQERIKLDQQVDELMKVKAAQDKIILGWQLVGDAFVAGSGSEYIGTGRMEDELAIMAVRSKVGVMFRSEKKIEIDVLRQVQTELRTIRDRYGELSGPGQKAFEETEAAIMRVLETSSQATEVLKQFRASGEKLSDLPPEIQDLLTFFEDTKTSINGVTTAVQELYSSLEKPPSIQDLKDQIDKATAQLKSGDAKGADLTLRSDEIRKRAGSEEFAVANAERINELVKERMDMLREEAQKSPGFLRGFISDLVMGPQRLQDATDYVKTQLAIEEDALLKTMGDLGDSVKAILDPPKSRSRTDPAEQELKSATSLLQNLNARYAAEQQLKDIQAAIGILRVKDADTLKEMGGILGLNIIAALNYKKTIDQIDKDKRQKAREDRGTAMFGNDEQQRVTALLDGFRNLQGRDKIIDDYKKKFQELFKEVGYGREFFNGLALGVKAMNDELSKFDTDELTKSMKDVDSVLDRFNGQFDGNSRDAQRKDLTSQMDTIQKLIDGGTLMGDSMDRAKRAVQLLGYELSKLTVVGDIFRVGLDTIESGLMNLADELLQGEMDWESWGRTIIRELYRVMIVKPIVDWVASALSMGMSNFIPGGVSGLIGGGNKLPGSGSTGLPAGRLGPAHTGGVIDEVVGMRSGRMHTGGMTKTMMERMSDVGSMIRGNEKLVNILAGSEVVKYGDKRNSQTPRPTIILKNEEILGPNHPLNVRNSSRRGSQGMFDKMHTGGVVGRAYGVSAQKAGGVSPAPVVNAPSQHLQKPMAVTIVTNVNVTDNGGGKQASGGRGLDPQMMKEVARQLSDSQRSGILDVMNRRETGRSMKVNG